MSSIEPRICFNPSNNLFETRHRRRDALHLPNPNHVDGNGTIRQTIRPETSIKQIAPTVRAHARRTSNVTSNVRKAAEIAEGHECDDILKLLFDRSYAIVSDALHHIRRLRRTCPNRNWIFRFTGRDRSCERDIEIAKITRDEQRASNHIDDSSRYNPGSHPPQRTHDSYDCSPGSSPPTVDEPDTSLTERVEPR